MFFYIFTKNNKTLQLTVFVFSFAETVNVIGFRNPPKPRTIFDLIVFDWPTAISVVPDVVLRDKIKPPFKLIVQSTPVASTTPTFYRH